MANLTVSLPENCKVDDLLKYTAEVSDIDHIDPFLIDFCVVVDSPN